MQYFANTIKLTIFFIIISFSTTSLISNSIYTILILGMLAGPFVAYLFLKKKGVYNSCVLIIFLLETAFVTMGFYNHFALAIYIGNLSLGIAMTSSIILCPIATYYLRGPASFLRVFPIVTIGFFAGFILSNPILLLPIDTLTSSNFFLKMIGLILIAFFTIFSTWKSRFVLLK